MSEKSNKVAFLKVYISFSTWDRLFIFSDFTLLIEMIQIK